MDPPVRIPSPATRPLPGAARREPEPVPSPRGRELGHRGHKPPVRLETAFACIPEHPGKTTSAPIAGRPGNPCTMNPAHRSNA